MSREVKGDDDDSDPLSELVNRFFVEGKLQHYKDYPKHFLCPVNGMENGIDQIS